MSTPTLHRPTLGVHLWSAVTCHRFSKRWSGRVASTMPETPRGGRGALPLPSDGPLGTRRLPAVSICDRGKRCGDFSQPCLFLHGVRRHRINRVLVDFCIHHGDVDVVLGIAVGHWAPAGTARSVTDGIIQHPRSCFSAVPQLLPAPDNGNSITSAGPIADSRQVPAG